MFFWLSSLGATSGTRWSILLLFGQSFKVSLRPFIDVGIQKRFLRLILRHSIARIPVENALDLLLLPKHFELKLLEFFIVVRVLEVS